MSGNWLKGPREAARIKQEFLAHAIGLDARILGRLERCEKETPKQVPYDRLAEVLKVCPIQLAEHHARDLDDTKLLEHASRARDEADRLRRARQFPAIDPQPLTRALVSCESAGLTQRIAERAQVLPGIPEMADAPAQAAHIAGLLNDRNLGDFANLVDIPLEETIGHTATIDHLDSLERFLRAIILACTATGDGLDPGRWHQHHGEPRAWPFRALIDRSRGLDGMRWVRAASDTAEARLDDGPDSTRAVRSGNVSQISADARLHQLVCAIADMLGTVDDDRPTSTDGQSFLDFCRTVNRELFRHNTRHTHVFGLWERCTCEAEDVKGELLRCLPNLRSFDGGDPARASTVLRVDGETLETWYASHLRAIDERRRTLATTSMHSPQPAQSTPHESRTMNESQNPQIQLNLNVNTGNGPANQSAGQAQANQYNQGTPQAELLTLLERLLVETGTGESRYADLRKACRNAQGEVEENKPISEETQSLFQRAIGALPAADKVIDLATKAADLIGKIPGLGA